MISKLRKYILITVGTLMLSLSLGAGLASAQTIQDSINNGVDAAAGDKGTGAQAQTTINSTANKVVNLLSLFVGIAAVVMIIIAGLSFVTAAGDAAKVGKARAMILYAVIGLIIVALAQIIVRFVLHNVTSSPPPAP